MRLRREHLALTRSQSPSRAACVSTWLGEVSTLYVPITHMLRSSSFFRASMEQEKRLTGDAPGMFVSHAAPRFAWRAARRAAALRQQGLTTLGNEMREH